MTAVCEQAAKRFGLNTEGKVEGQRDTSWRRGMDSSGEEERTRKRANLKVSVQDVGGMDVLEPAQNLIDEVLYVVHCQRLPRVDNSM